MKQSLLSSMSMKAGGFLFPPICIKCKSHARGTGLDAWLCTSCMSLLEQNHAARTGHACPLCSQNLLAKTCDCDAARNMPYEKMYSLFDFDDTLKTIVHEFKYGGFKRLAFDMGKTYVSLIPPQFFDGMDLITSVPLHFLRRIKRGYNQADYFALGVISGAGLALKFHRDIVKRKRTTKTQTTLTREDRLKNVAGAFAIPKKKQTFIKDKSVILVDDVVTTGATTAQCAAVLREAGAKSVRILSLARD